MPIRPSRETAPPRPRTRYAGSGRKKVANNMECVSRDSEDTDFTADTLMPGPPRPERARSRSTSNKFPSGHASGCSIIHWRLSSERGARESRENRSGLTRTYYTITFAMFLHDLRRLMARDKYRKDANYTGQDGLVNSVGWNYYYRFVEFVFSERYCPVGCLRWPWKFYSDVSPEATRFIHATRGSSMFYC